MITSSLRDNCGPRPAGSDITMSQHYSVRESFPVKFNSSWDTLSIKLFSSVNLKKSLIFIFFYISVQFVLGRDVVSFSISGGQ